MTRRLVWAMRVLVSCSFAPDALEPPLRTWATHVLGVRPALAWAPYGAPLAGLRRPGEGGRGAAAGGGGGGGAGGAGGGGRLMVVRLQDLAV